MSLFAPSPAKADSPQVLWINSAPGQYWQTMSAPVLHAPSGGSANISVSTDLLKQRIDGFGGCVNELGWQAIQKASPADQANIMNSLYGSNGCNFNMSRVPIGASDFALSAYSLDDTSGDYSLANFSIARDQQNLLPFLKAAMQVQPNLKVWGSPWSPPAWMKTNNNYAGGAINATPQVFSSYANYLVNWAEAYKAQGVNVMAVTPQNEPTVSSQYPSCTWTAPQLRDFIGSYLGPTLQSRDPSVQLWLGTLNGFDNSCFSIGSTVLTDPAARPYLSAFTLQYAAGQAASMHATYPDLPIVESETVCNSGANSWSDASNLYSQMKQYMDGGASSYFMWNMVLNQTGLSSWNWAQNAMINVDQNTGAVTYNGEYYVMRHFSQFVQPGAHEATCTGTWGDKIAFVNPDGSVVMVVRNTLSSSYAVTLDITGGTGAQEMNVTLPANSVSTFVIPAPEPATLMIGLTTACALLLRRKSPRPD